MCFAIIKNYFTVGAVLVYGKIISLVGDEAVAEVDSSKAPRLGRKVSINGKFLGKTFDLIGNVNKPYCVIKLGRKHPASNKKIVGEQISVEE